MLLQSYFSFPVLTRKTILYKKNRTSCIYYLPLQRFFVFNDGQITDGDK